MEWLSENTQLLQEYATTGMYFGVALLLTWAFSQIALLGGNKWLESHNWTVKHIDAKRYFRYPIRLLFLSIFLHIFSPLMDLPENLHKTFLHSVEILTIVSLTLIVLAVGEYTKRILFDRFEINENDPFKQRKMRTQLQFVYRMGISFIFLISIAAVLMSFEGARQIGTSIIASAGVASIVIGFAAQKSLGNLIAGFQIAFTQPLRLDDTIFVENDWGLVEEISLSYVIVKYWDNRRLILPITYFIEKPFQNWTRNTTEISGSIIFYADYTAPMDALRKQAEQILIASELWDRRVFDLLVTGFNDRAVEIRIDMSSRNANDLFLLRCHMREKIIDFLQETYPNSLPSVRSMPVSKTDTIS